jgi:hypothetical protein
LDLCIKPDWHNTYGYKDSTNSRRKEENLLSIDGVVGAGIARDEDNNYIIGIAVYVEDGIIDIKKIPSKLGEFDVFIKRINEATEFERERMILHKEYWQTHNNSVPSRSLTKKIENRSQSFLQL